MNVTFLLIATVLFAFYSILMKYVPSGNLRFILLVTALYAGIIGVMYSVMFVFDDHVISAATVMWSVIKGLLGIVVQAAYFAAMQKGPLSYTTFIFSASMIVPAVGSAILWNETITPAQWLAIALFLAAFYLICIPGADKSKSIEKSWLPLCLTAFLINGILSLIVKAQQMAVNGKEGNAMMAISSLTTFVVAFAVFVLWASVKKERTAYFKETGTAVKAAAGAIVGVSLCNGIANGFVTYLASRISGAWLFPFVLGGSMVLVTLFSATVFKEKINNWGKLGLAVGLAAMVVMNIV